MSDERKGANKEKIIKLTVKSKIKVKIIEISQDRLRYSPTKGADLNMGSIWVVKLSATIVEIIHPAIDTLSLTNPLKKAKVPDSKIIIKTIKSTMFKPSILKP